MAFRVTAGVLKQASGKVRCGGCGHAFNSLDYLSETKPVAPPRGDSSETLPELTPEPAGDDYAEAAPRTMSPEQSAALLKTLDELAGADIRLEDTGVEWRLLPDDAGDKTGEDVDEVIDAGATPVDAELTADAGASRVDELLEEAPTRVDEFLTRTPDQVEAAEVFDVEANAAADELRFDDHTGLPEDFDDETDEAAATAGVSGGADATAEHESVELSSHTDTHVDIVFGEPEEWNELLDEVEGDAGAADDLPTTKDFRDKIIEPDEAGRSAGAPGPTLAEELDALPDDDAPLDIDTQFDLQAEALGISTGSAAENDAASDSSIEQDLIAAAFEAEKAAQDLIDASQDASRAGRIADSETPDDDDHGTAAEFENDDIDAVDDRATSDEDDVELEVAEIEFDADDDDGREVAADDSDDDIDAAIELLDAEASAAREDDADDEFPDSTRALEIELSEAEKLHAAAALDDDAEPGADAADIEVPPETEEEQTINRMIDQDLLRLAGEARDDDDSDANAEQAAAPAGVGVETIIMEGEFVRTALEQEALDAAATRDEEEDTGFIAAAKRSFRGRMDTDADDEKRPSRLYGMAAGIVVLLLVLSGQFVHQSRAELATNPTINRFIAPIYRAIGAPITPNWDITAWRFEVTRGSTNASGLAAELRDDGTGVDLVAEPVADDESAADDVAVPLTEPADEPEVLTIYSRIGNQSNQPLPYPLVSVSLTDRVEEVIGSRVLEPRDYLSGGADPSRPVPPGNTFDAVIAIESPAAEATGFKLNVCYRQSGGRLRCAIEDFK